MQICPYCKKEFKKLNMHKCKWKPKTAQIFKTKEISRGTPDIKAWREAELKFPYKKIEFAIPKNEEEKKLFESFVRNSRKRNEELTENLSGVSLMAWQKKKISELSGSLLISQEGNEIAQEDDFEYLKKTIKEKIKKSKYD